MQIGISHIINFALFVLICCSNQTKFHYSLDNLQQTKAKVATETKKQIKASRSWDSICRSKGAKAAPNLPIAQSTARILKRNGVQPNDANGNKRLAENTLHDR